MPNSDEKPLPPIIPSVNSVPPGLMDELHAATENFHNQKQQVEAATGSNEFGHATGIEAATAELRKAESDLEAVDQKVKDALKQ